MLLYFTYINFINMNFIRQPKLVISPLKLHSVSTVHIPSAHNVFTRKANVNIPKVNLHSASSFHIPNSTSIFKNIPMVKLTPLRSPIARRHYHGKSFHNSYWSSRQPSFPSISKCNVKRCSSCRYLSCKSNIRSTTNGRVFPINISTDIT